MPDGKDVAQQAKNSFIKDAAKAMPVVEGVKGAEKVADNTPDRKNTPNTSKTDKMEGGENQKPANESGNDKKTTNEKDKTEGENTPKEKNSSDQTEGRKVTRQDNGGKTGSGVETSGEVKETKVEEIAKKLDSRENIHELNNLSKDDLGNLLGKGGNKEVYAVGNDKVVAIMQKGKPLSAIERELEMLQELQKLGLPTINARAILVDGNPAIIMDRCIQESKSIVALNKRKKKIMLVEGADTSLLNKNSVSDLELIKKKMIDKKIKIDDLQFLIKEDGHIVISDPLQVIVGENPSKNNLRMIDILIEEAKKITRRRLLKHENFF